MKAYHAPGYTTTNKRSPQVGELVPVTTWVPADQLDTSRLDYRWPLGVSVSWCRTACVISGLVLALTVVATLVICVGIALLALVEWVTVHAVEIGTVIAAMVCATVLLLLALARSRMALAYVRNAGRPDGRCR